MLCTPARRSAAAAVLVVVATALSLAVAIRPALAAEPSDIAVWRPSTGTWYIRGQSPIHYGATGDVPVPADYDGDGKADLAVWRPSNGTWYLRGRPASRYGIAGDVPVPADYNGDGKTDLAVWRPSNGTWYIVGVGTFQWGARGDRPVPADYTGDHRARLAVWRPSRNTWYIRDVGTYVYGTATDTPVPADYSSYDQAEVAVWRPSTATWYVRGRPAARLGRPGDTPVAGDFDADGQVRLAVWRPSTGTWYVQGAASVTWGRTGDIPVPANYVNRNAAGRLAVRRLTPDGADVAAVTASSGVITMSAAATNHPAPSNLRKLFWTVGQTPVTDGRTCATWADESDPMIQEGLALRITTGPTGTRAITVSKNVIYGVYWVFNVHVWDPTQSQPFIGLGQFDFAPVVTANGGYQRLPWRICAQAVGAAFTFKVWLPDREPEPSWTDPVHTATTQIPAGYLGPGTSGWYVGHIPPGATAHYTDLVVGAAQPASPQLFTGVANMCVRPRRPGGLGGLVTQAICLGHAA